MDRVVDRARASEVCDRAWRLLCGGLWRVLRSRRHLAREVLRAGVVAVVMQVRPISARPEFIPLVLHGFRAPNHVSPGVPIVLGGVLTGLQPQARRAKLT